MVPVILILCVVKLTCHLLRNTSAGVGNRAYLEGVRLGANCRCFRQHMYADYVLNVRHYVGTRRNKTKSERFRCQSACLHAFPRTSFPEVVRRDHFPKRYLPNG